jgi:hypothetical protein
LFTLLVLLENGQVWLSLGDLLCVQSFYEKSWVLRSRIYLVDERRPPKALPS